MNISELDKIVAKFLKGNHKAFDKLFEHYWEQLYTIAFIKLKDADHAEELVQTLFVEIWERRKQIRIKSSFNNYLFSALKYKIFRHISNLNRKEQLSDLNHPFSDQVDDYLNFSELQNYLEESIKGLPEKCKIIFTKRKLEDMSVREIADELNLSESTVNNQLTKANKIVRDQLSNVYGLPSISIFFLL